MGYYLNTSIQAIGKRVLIQLGITGEIIQNYPYKLGKVNAFLTMPKSDIALLGRITTLTG
jgi:hypothetical protein